MVKQNSEIIRLDGEDPENLIQWDDKEDGHELVVYEVYSSSGALRDDAGDMVGWYYYHRDYSPKNMPRLIESYRYGPFQTREKALFEGKNAYRP